jgi:[protein-PII] uridylyltransferase
VTAEPAESVAQHSASSLAGALAAIAEEGDVRSGTGSRAVRAVLKSYLAEGRKDLRARFEAGVNRGLEAARSTANLTDEIVDALYGFTVRYAYPRSSNPTDADRLALVAVGGYGRAEMAPFSDVDLLFLFPYKQTPWVEQVAEYMLHLLWDLGLKVGHAMRSVDDCVRLSRTDGTIRTSILEARLLCGDPELFRDLRVHYRADMAEGTGPAFVEDKLRERDERHKRFGDSRYLVEPNVKDGKGGLRDLHTLFWMAKYLYHVERTRELVGLGVFTEREFRRFSKAESFLWSVRIHLHYLAGRAEERMTFDVQSDLASRLGYKAHTGMRAVERFMKHYFLFAKEVGDLTRIFCAVLEDRHKRKPRFRFGRAPRKETVGPFRIEGVRVDVADEHAFSADAVNLLRLFHLAQERGLDIHPRALRLVTQNLRRVDQRLRDDPDAGTLFLDMLTSRKDPETTLRRLNEAGVFGRFMPDFGRVVAQMQHDMYHVYTVDEHTIRAIGILSQVEAGKLEEDHPLANEIVHKVISRRVLYVAVLLHDIAKGRGGDHSVLGAEVAERVGPTLGLTPEETETVAWLVAHHLDMSKTAFRRDVNDPQTIADFVEVMQSPERLRLLLVLTVVDIRAVGPGRWNGWSGQLLRELYHATEEALAGGDSAAGASRTRVAKARTALAAALAEWPKEEREAYAAQFYPSYWASFDLATQVHHANFLRNASRDPGTLEVDSVSDRFRAVTELTIYTADHAGLFAGVAGAMAVSGVNIVSARVFTMHDGMALESLLVQGAHGGPIEGAEAIANLKRTIGRVLSHEVSPDAILRQRREAPGRSRVFTVVPRVLVDNQASAKHTVIEVNARDRRGLLYTVTKALADFGVSVATARIATYGERAVDVFYLQDLIGHKITSEERLDLMREHLIAAVTEYTDDPLPAASGTSTAA